MKKHSVILTVVVLGLLTWGSAYAGNITIMDEAGSGSNWYSQSREDQEVEYNCITGQNWDLEAFYLTGSTLSMVGGYDFVHGVAGYSAASGDIFIDTDGDAQYGAGAHAPANYSPNQVVTDTFGYDYVIDLDFASMTYSVYDISAPGAQFLTTVNEQANDAANPWRRLSGGALVTTGSIAYESGLTDAEAQDAGYDVTGGLHNIASVDLAWLAGGSFTSHYTMQCGNDNLMGQIVPEPATLLLFGMGCLGVALRRRMRA